MNSFTTSVAAILLSCMYSATGFSVKKPETQKISFERFSITESANESDWAFFFASKANWRLSLWNYQAKLGHSLKDWHWSWRIGWVKSCIKKPDFKMSHCKAVTSQAKDDKALVVRAELVNLLGTVYSGSKDKDAIETLKGLFEDKRNQRAGRPLYIQKQILYAIKEIGGKHATVTASNLAKTHPEVAAYHRKLERIE